MTSLLLVGSLAFAGEVEVAVDAANGNRIYMEQFLNVDADDFPVIRTLPGGERVKIEVTDVAGTLEVCTSLAPTLSSPFVGPCTTVTGNSGLHAQLLPGGEIIGHYASTDSSDSDVEIPASLGSMVTDPAASGSSSGTVACSGCCGSGEDRVCIDWTCPEGEDCDQVCDESGIVGSCY